MDSPNESLYSYILRTYHGNDVRKRKKTVLFKNVPKTINDIVIPSEGWNSTSARINNRNLKKMSFLLVDKVQILILLILITYLYIRPFLRLSCLVLLISFRGYHSIHPEIISARMNESFIIRSFWTNYYTNPGFLINAHYIITKPRIESSTQPDTQPDTRSNLQVETKHIIPIVSKSGDTPIQISTSRMQVVFTTNYTESKKLLRPAIARLNNTMMLVDFTKPLLSSISSLSSLSSLSSKKTVDTKSKITEQIITSKPTKTKKPNISIGNKNKPQKKQKHNAISKKRSNSKSKSKVATKRNSKLESSEYIYGYVNVDKGIIVIYEDGIPYFYKVSKEFIYNYLLTNQDF